MFFVHVNVTISKKFSPYIFVTNEDFSFFLQNHKCRQRHGALQTELFAKAEEPTGERVLPGNRQRSKVWEGVSRAGTDVMIFKKISPNFSAKKLAFLTQNKA
jgi:hypothetical protein